MRRFVISILVVFVFTGVPYCQLKTLATFEEMTIAKIKIGMTPGEVKRAIGNPQSIEGGFPNSSEEIIEEMPEQVGQLNNSTWFYVYKLIRIEVDDDTTLYTINGVSVSSTLYDEYKGSDSILIYKGELVSKSWIVDDYRINGIMVSKEVYNGYSTSDSIYLFNGHIMSIDYKHYPGTTAVKKNSSDTYVAHMYTGKAITPSRVWKNPKLTSVIVKHSKISKSFMPVLCVIFDRGTQVVADGKVFFEINSQAVAH